MIKVNSGYKELRKFSSKEKHSCSNKKTFYRTNDFVGPRSKGVRVAKLLSLLRKKLFNGMFNLIRLKK